MLVIKCNLVVFLAYLVKPLCLNVPFMFLSSIIFSPVLSNMFHHSQIYSQLIFQIIPFRHISLVKKACVDTQKYEFPFNLCEVSQFSLSIFAIFNLIPRCDSVFQPLASYCNLVSVHLCDSQPHSIF